MVLLGEQVAGNAVFLGLPVDRITGIAWGGPQVQDISYLPENKGLLQVANVGSFVEPDLEKVVQLAPDLILHFGFDNDATRTRRDRWAAAGIPVFTVYNGYATFDETMRFLREIALALNLEEKAAEEEATLRAALDALRGRFAGRQMPSIATIRPFPDGTFYANASPLLEALGVPGPRPTAKEMTVQYSEERLRDLEADYIVVYGVGGDSAETARARMETSPLWQSLRAVQEGRVRYVEPVAWLNWNVPALYLGLADIETMLSD